jgi:FixJ family two-component response regulator
MADEAKRSTTPADGPVVYIVDDDISVREALEALIQEAGWRPLVFASALQFLSQPRSPSPSCLILDLTLPDLNGLELQQKIAADRPEMPIIFITGHGDVPTTVRAMKAGAVEFLTKPFADEDLLSAVRGALDRSAAALHKAEEWQILHTRYASLSRREREVLRLVVSGLMNKQVAGQLGVSEITVKAHRGRVMRKMKADTFADLVNIATKLGLRDDQRTPED